MYRSMQNNGFVKQNASIVGSFFLASIVLALFASGAKSQAPVNVQPGTKASVRAQLIGSWRLVSRESRRENGQIEGDPGLSTLPLGILIYDQSGHVAAQLSRRDRTISMFRDECPLAAEIKGTSDTAQTVLGYDAYFGTYTLNENDGIVVHHLEAAIWPGDIGKSIERHFTLSGDRLTITFNTTTKDGIKVKRTLIWERMK